MSSKPEDQFTQSRLAMWQYNEDMEVLMDGLKAERETLYGDIRMAKAKGLGTDWILGEMMGLDKAIAILTPDITEHQ